jgi:hypothetical protein
VTGIRFSRLPAMPAARKGRNPLGSRLRTVRALGASHTRSAWIVALTVTVTVVVMFVGPFEDFSAADLNRIRAAESQFTTACSGTGDEHAASQSASVLLGYLRRNPTQLLPLHGASQPFSMHTELSVLLAATATGPCSRLPRLRTEIAEELYRER